MLILSFNSKHQLTLECVSNHLRLNPFMQGIKYKGISCLQKLSPLEEMVTTFFFCHQKIPFMILVYTMEATLLLASYALRSQNPLSYLFPIVYGLQNLIQTNLFITQLIIAWLWNKHSLLMNTCISKTVACLQKNFLSFSALLFTALSKIFH